MARVKSGSISLIEATLLLGISYRQAKRLYARYKARGTSGTFLMVLDGRNFRGGDVLFLQIC